MAWDRLRDPELRGKVAIAHYVNAALAAAPTSVDEALDLAASFQSEHEGRGPRLAGTRTRVHRDVAAAMARMETLLLIRQYGRHGLFVAGSVRRFLDQLDQEDPIEDPALLGG